MDNDNGSYAAFLARKAQEGSDAGFEPLWMPDFLFDFQRVLPYKKVRDADDERHVHPLQLDVIDRVLVLRSNPGETVLTPFMGIGSEAFAAVSAGRRAVGIELKETYYRQALKNLQSLKFRQKGILDA